MCNQRRTDDLVRKANRSYSAGDFSQAREYLLQASNIKGASQETKAGIYDYLAAIACEQGQFSSAVWWYRKVLSIRSHQYALGTSELKKMISNYKALLSLRQKNGQPPRVRLTA